MLRITNRDCRRILLWANGLSPKLEDQPSTANIVNPKIQRVYETIYKLGFVQVDPVSVVERAHHHILFTRNRFYRKNQLKQLLEKDRVLFENWTHDAAILPAACYPYWKHYFARARIFEAHPGYRKHFAPVTAKLAKMVLDRVGKEGPLRPRDFEGHRVVQHDPYFAQPTLEKLTMEFLWRTGELAVSHRRGQEKVYDLARRVIPACHFKAEVSRGEFLSWACSSALARLGVARPAQIAHFYDAVSTADATRWCESQMSREVTQVEIALADGSVSNPVYMLTALVEILPQIHAPSRGLRLISPFDPLIYDRRRTNQVFGFDYSLEMWVPASKRRYGYYVLPILEGWRLTGRINLKTDRKRGVLQILGLWWEPQTKLTRRRRAGLEAALARLVKVAISK